MNRFLVVLIKRSGKEVKEIEYVSFSSTRLVG